MLDLRSTKITRPKCVKNGMKQHLDNASMAKSVNSSMMKTQQQKLKHSLSSKLNLLHFSIRTTRVISSTPLTFKWNALNPLNLCQNWTAVFLTKIFSRTFRSKPLTRNVYRLCLSHLLKI
jgi:hypothetical protein